MLTVYQSWFVPFFWYPYHDPISTYKYAGAGAGSVGSSALVCAPTSSGKTFVSSYVVQRCLNEGDEGWVAMVLPTKALVNQVSAQVSSRGRSMVCGFH